MTYYQIDVGDAAHLEENMKWETGSGFTLLQYQEADLQSCIGLGQDHLWLLKFCEMSPIEFNLRNQNQGASGKDLLYISTA